MKWLCWWCLQLRIYVPFRSRFLTLFFCSYFCLIGPFSYLSRTGSFPQPLLWSFVIGLKAPADSLTLLAAGCLYNWVVFVPLHPWRLVVFTTEYVTFRYTPGSAKIDFITFNVEQIALKPEEKAENVFRWRILKPVESDHVLGEFFFFFGQLLLRHTSVLNLVNTEPPPYIACTLDKETTRVMFIRTCVHALMWNGVPDKSSARPV